MSGVNLNCARLFELKRQCRRHVNGSKDEVKLELTTG